MNNNFLEALRQRKKELQKIIHEKKKALKTAPVGGVRAIPHGKGYQYYLRKDSKDKNGKYIKKSDIELARQLAQKEYDVEILERATKEVSFIETIENTYNKQAVLEDVYEKLSVGKKRLIKPIRVSDEEFLNGWRTENYEKMGFREDSNVFYSQKGEAMRSKSEVLIAGILDKYKLPYRYEKPLYLNSYGQVRPDFTILDINSRKEIYLEHLGLIDDTEYRNKALLKIQAYEENGFYLGDRLILTAETYKHPLNINAVERRIKHMFYIK